jgi:glycosyltransferase involved in cell wall biosynthesis
MSTSRARPLFSVVVPCYNYARFLPDCLDSIFGQVDVSDFEIIAIDDCSKDDTLEVLETYRDPRLRVIRHETNQGHIVTINQGLYLASGTYVARIDPDDRYRSDCFRQALAGFQTYPEVGVVYGDAAMIGSDGVLILDRCDKAHGGRPFRGNEYLALLACNFVCAPTVVARREAWRAALPAPDGLSFSDWWYNLQMARRFPFFYTHEVFADYRVHGSNHHTRISANKTEEGSIFRVLNQLYAERELDPELDRAKWAARARVYAAQYLDQARKYFGHGHYADARRCYWEAFRRQPERLFNSETARHFAATFLGKAAYERLKRLLKPT